MTGCPTGKISYPSHAAALEALRIIHATRRKRRKRKVRRLENNTYQCDQCRWWHLATSQSPARAVHSQRQA